MNAFIFITWAAVENDSRKQEGKRRNLWEGREASIWSRLEVMRLV